MKEKDLTRKELLAQEVGMKFDEVAPVFSEETLNTMTMTHIVGGLDDTYSGNCVPGCTNTNCNGAHCVPGCGDTNGKKCTTGDNPGAKVGNCNSGSQDAKVGCATTPTSKP
ncbi:hypothetical protein [Bacteroides congonensis]|uniref:hypothetical protein n=1 Tax=Bacteroides congonensis TaxID=1871006 RepID=UPI002FDB80ED